MKTKKPEAVQTAAKKTKEHNPVGDGIFCEACGLSLMNPIHYPIRVGSFSKKGRR